MAPDFPPLPPVDWGNIEAPVMEGQPTEAAGDEDALNSSDLVRPPPQKPIRDLQEYGTGGPSESRDFEAAPDFLEEGYWDEMNYEGIEAGWYADAASSFEDRGSVAPDEQALQDFPEFTAAEQQDLPPALSGSLADADVIRHAIQLEREQAKSSLPKQVWEMPAPLSYPCKVKRKLEISGIPSVLAADPYVPEVPQPIQAVRPAIRKLLRRLGACFEAF